MLRHRLNGREGASPTSDERFGKSPSVAATANAGAADTGGDAMIIRDYIHESGARVIVADDCAARPGTPEHARVMDGIMRAAEKILIGYAQRAEEEGEDTNDTEAD